MNKIIGHPTVNIKIDSKSIPISSIHKVQFMDGRNHYDAIIHLRIPAKTQMKLAMQDIINKFLQYGVDDPIKMQLKYGRKNDIDSNKNIELYVRDIVENANSTIHEYIIYAQDPLNYTLGHYQTDGTYYTGSISEIIKSIVDKYSSNTINSSIIDISNNDSDVYYTYRMVAIDFVNYLMFIGKQFSNSKALEMVVNNYNVYINGASNMRQVPIILNSSYTESRAFSANFTNSIKTLLTGINKVSSDISILNGDTHSILASGYDTVKPVSVKIGNSQAFNLKNNINNYVEPYIESARTKTKLRTAFMNEELANESCNLHHGKIKIIGNSDLYPNDCIYTINYKMMNNIVPTISGNWIVNAYYHKISFTNNKSSWTTMMMVNRFPSNM